MSGRCRPTSGRLGRCFCRVPFVHRQICADLFSIFFECGMHSVWINFCTSQSLASSNLALKKNLENETCIVYFDHRIGTFCGANALLHLRPYSAMTALHCVHRVLWMQNPALNHWMCGRWSQDRNDPIVLCNITHRSSNSAFTVVLKKIWIWSCLLFELLYFYFEIIFCFFDISRVTLVCYASINFTVRWKEEAESTDYFSFYLDFHLNPGHATSFIKYYGICLRLVHLTKSRWPKSEKNWQQWTLTLELDWNFTTTHIIFSSFGHIHPLMFVIVVIFIIFFGHFYHANFLVMFTNFSHIHSVIFIQSYSFSHIHSVILIRSSE